jgi:hypothetical protein
MSWLKPRPTNIPASPHTLQPKREPDGFLIPTKLCFSHRMEQWNDAKFWRSSCR